MKKLFLVLYILVSIVFLIYLILPDPKFPAPPTDSTQSMEKADIESPSRRAYFTNFTREEVVNFYQKQFGTSMRLRDYPPEEAQTLIRDQTRSTFLEELVHPFRESLFVNGFEPGNPKDEIWYKGIHYRQKIIIKFVPSRVYVRLAIAISTLIVIWFVGNEIVDIAKSLIIKKRK